MLIILSLTSIILIIIITLIIMNIIMPYLQYKQYLKYGKGRFIPIIGELAELQESQQKYHNIEYHLQHYLDSNQNQKLSVANVGNKVKLRLFDAELIKEFFMNQKYYVKDETFTANIKRFVKNGIVTSEGQIWKNSRKIFSQAFHYDYLQKLSPQIENITESVFNEVIKNNNNEMSNFDSIKYMQEITGRVIIASFFGETLEDQSVQGMKIIQGLSYVLNKLGDQTMTLQYYIFGSKYFELGLRKEDRQLNEYISELDELIQEQINKKIDEFTNELNTTGQIKNACILGQLIISGQINQLSREQLYFDFKTFYLAGMDTTGHLLGMTVYYLSQNQDIYQKLKYEIDSNHDQTSNGLFNLNYLNAVIKETLRYYGPGNIMFDRIATQDHILGDIPIKKGMLVTPYAITLQRDSKYYEEPHKYNPDRWLKNNNNNNKQCESHSYSYIPFSAGARNCIGQHLALLESRIILNKFIQTFDFICPDNYQLIMGYKFLAEPIQPFNFILTKRSNNQ